MQMQAHIGLLYFEAEVKLFIFIALVLNIFMKKLWNLLGKMIKQSCQIKQKIGNCYNSETNQRKLCSKKLSKYVSTFNYIDKILTVLNATTGGVCKISHVTLLVLL